ncbi:DUF3368 domain-containing protein [Anaerolineales bacterium HSG24]|nr:DUF3368 domain-containing protein [Anaerolineales bacterium HSG24]
MPKQTVVVNATPCISLALIGHFELLQRLYETIIIPPAVQREVLVGGAQYIGVTELKQASWVKTVPLQNPRQADLLVDLDRGEAEVIILAQEHQADVVIIDERLGRRYAKRVGLAVTGTLGVLLKAKSEGHIPLVAPLVQKLVQGGIHLSSAVVDRTIQMAGE